MTEIKPIDAEDLEFVGLPPGRARRKWDAVRDALRARPGEWANLPCTTNPYTAATSVKRWQPPGVWEARVRAGKLYARYIGNAS